MLLEALSVSCYSIPGLHLIGAQRGAIFGLCYICVNCCIYFAGADGDIAKDTEFCGLIFIILRYSSTKY